MKRTHRITAAMAVITVAAAAVLVTTNLVADTAAAYLPPDQQGPDLNRMKLQADKRFGFAPMTVNLSGMIETKSGDLLPVMGGQDIRLVVESPFLNVQSSVPVSNLVSDIHYEATSAGPDAPSPFRRALEIRKPGKYIFRVHVLNPDGTVLSSNEVMVRAL